MVKLSTKTLLLSIMCALCEGCHVDHSGKLSECGLDAPNDGHFVIADAGENHFCAVRHPTLSVQCWPHSYISAPTYLKDVHALTSGATHSCAIWGGDRQLTCWGKIASINGDVNVTKGARMLSASDMDARHVCFLRESNNDISCFGENDRQQLGFETNGLSVSAKRLRAD
jgi:hypothetical protein